MYLFQNYFFSAAQFFRVDIDFYSIGSHSITIDATNFPNPFFVLRVWANSLRRGEFGGEFNLTVRFEDPSDLQMDAFAYTLHSLAADQKRFTGITLYLSPLDPRTVHRLLLAIATTSCTELKIQCQWCGWEGSNPHSYKLQQHTIPNFTLLTQLTLAELDLSNHILQSMVRFVLRQGTVERLSLVSCGRHRILSETISLLTDITTSVDYGINNIFEFLSRHPQLTAIEIIGTPKVLRATRQISGSLPQLRSLRGTAFLINRIIRQFSTRSSRFSLNFLDIDHDFDGHELHGGRREQWLRKYHEKVYAIMKQCDGVDRLFVELPPRDYFPWAGPPTKFEPLSNLAEISVWATGYTVTEMQVRPTTNVCTSS